MTMAACGGDDDGDNPMMCGGHGQPACEGSAWALEKEGGLARAELVTYIDGSQTLGVFAFFFNSQVPPLQSTDGIQVEGTRCQDLRSGLVYDTGPYPQSQAINDTRTYLDMGATVTLDNLGSGEDFVLAKQTNTIDGSNFLVHDIVYATSTVGVTAEDAAKVQHPGTYAIKFNGSGWSDTDMKNGTSKTLTADNKEQKVAAANMYMPASWTAVNPPENAAAVIPNNADFTFTWTNGSDPGEHAGILNFVGWGDATSGALDFFCVDDSDSGAQDFTVPASVISQVDQEGWIVHGKATHVAYDLKGFRYDLSGVNCHTYGYSKE
jgi:hypothetical protein